MKDQNLKLLLLLMLLVTLSSCAQTDDDLHSPDLSLKYTAENPALKSTDSDSTGVGTEHYENSPNSSLEEDPKFPPRK